MVPSIVGQQPVDAAHAAPELTIEIWRDEFFSYTATAAELVAEGLIPEGFVWPRAAERRTWQAGGFDYWLQRTRPEGHKGKPSSWWTLDNWTLRVCVTGRDYWWRARKQLERRAEELRQDWRRLTPQGQAEWTRNYKRYQAAETDPAFQTFKALVPGLAPAKRGRKPKAAQ